MKKLHQFFIALTIFYSILYIFTNIIRIENQDSILNKLIIGTSFAILITLVPNFLKFFKLPVNTGSLFLITLTISFIFFILSVNILNLISIIPGKIDQIIFLEIRDETIGIALISFATSFLSVLIEKLNNKRY